MIVVMDTSVGAEIVLQRTHAGFWAGHLQNADWVIAPNLYIAEITNVFWKYHTFQDLPADICETCIENALMLPDDYAAETDLYREAFALACNTQMTVYDMFFLVLARRHNAFLATMDKKLKNTAENQSVRTL